MTAPDIDFILRRGVAEIIDEGELRKMLQSGKQLRLKMGFDPSRPDLTLGHVVGLRKLRQFQQLGHKLILIVGDWTAQIGDPSGQSLTRPMLTAEEVKSNAETYLRQFFRVVDPEQTEVVWQSGWFGNFTLADVIKLTSRFTVAQMLQRDDFGKRYAEGRPIAITEFLYPLLQAYDSVEVRADVEFGGTDQLFNLMVGRELQGMVGQKPQQVFTVPLLVGTDGRVKMSKSLGNYIAVEDTAIDMYGKVMSLPDHVIVTYFELLTDVPDADLGEMRRGLEDGSAHPMALKQRLGREIVQQFHGEAGAAEAEEHFRRVFQDRDFPEDAPVFRLADLPAGIVLQQNAGVVVLDVVALNAHVGLAKSKSEARRLLDQGAVEANGRRVTEAVATVELPCALKVGKRRFLRIIE